MLVSEIRQNILKKELERRIDKNPSYSLRAFASALGIGNSTLSMILSGKRHISQKTAEQLVRKLVLNEEELQLFVGKRAKQESIELGQELFYSLADWVHYALLALVEVPNFKPNATWIAKKLKISPAKAKLSLEHIMNLGMLEEKEDGWARKEQNIRVENKTSTLVTQKFHKQLLEKAIESLENDPMEVRDISSMTMAIDEDLIPYARQRIRDFRRELTQELEGMSSTDKRVYNLTVQIYPISKKGDIQ